MTGTDGTAAGKVVSSLLGLLECVRDTGAGKWSARCPTHEDSRNSLCIGIGDDGRALLFCQAGCETKDIVAAVGLTMADLMPPSNHASNGKQRGKTVETYDYRDESGELLFQAVRLDPKDFLQRKPKPGGGWIWSVKGVRQVVYHLPELRMVIPIRQIDRFLQIGHEMSCKQ